VRLFVREPKTGAVRYFLAVDTDAALARATSFVESSVAEALRSSSNDHAVSLPAYSPWSLTLNQGDATLLRWRGRETTWLVLRSHGGDRALEGRDLDEILATHPALRDLPDVVRLEARARDFAKAYRLSPSTVEQPRRVVLDLYVTPTGATATVVRTTPESGPESEVTVARHVAGLFARSGRLRSLRPLWFETTRLSLRRAGLVVTCAGDGEASVVTSVRPNGPAARSGLQPGDTLLNADDDSPASLDDVRRLLGQPEGGAGRPRNLVVRRGGEKLEIQLRLADAADPVGRP
jgi:hypothetical protein